MHSRARPIALVMLAVATHAKAVAVQILFVSHLQVSAPVGAKKVGFCQYVEDCCHVRSNSFDSSSSSKVSLVMDGLAVFLPHLVLPLPVLPRLVLPHQE